MSLDRAFLRLALPRVLKALEGWSVGRLALHLPDGSFHTFGPSGAEPGVEVWIDRPGFFRKLLLKGDLGAGESYMDGDWRTDDLARFVALVLLNRRQLPLESGLTRMVNVGSDLVHRLRANTRRGSRRNIRQHYDLGNDFFGLFLDDTMTYSCAVFESPDQPLAAAQANKYRRMAEKVRIGRGDHVLEIGCGWGGFAVYAARQYGCRVTGVTLSPRQHEMARQRVAEAGLDGRVEVKLQDYRDVTGQFDRIVSIEMFEALGYENWPEFFRKCDELLAESGLVAIQTISIPDHRFDEYRRHCDWLQRYIFPGSVLASLHHLTGAMAGASTLSVHHLEDIGIHYALTLRRWREAFAGRLPEVRALGFDDRFIRMWEYYFASCEAAFATRTLGDLQLVLTRPCNLSLPGVPESRRLAA